ncbi:MAG: site-specific DNA-methyltransferase [Chloroflexales bacterium]|nr:site-specific DNA-methyltransferase [Chloroflexales bacterium]
MSYAVARLRNQNSDANKLYDEDRAIHEWYRFVLSFPPHLVRHYLERFGAHSGYRILDPFCGTATTLVECKKHGIEGVGIEGNPVAHFAGCVKTAWDVNPSALVAEGQRIAEMAHEQLFLLGIQDEMPLLPTTSVDIALRTLPAEQAALILTNSISPLPLHKALVLRDSIYQEAEPAYQRHLLLALIKALVNNASNLHFGPEVGLGAIKDDAAVIAPWFANVQAMAQDISAFQDTQRIPSVIHRGDARSVATILPERSIDCVITSPPYPNEKDYTRTTRLEAVFLGFIHNKSELRAMKKGLVRSNTRGVYKEDNDHEWIANLPRIQELAERIEQRRIELGKTSGFERLYARVTRLYFGGMARHFAALRTSLVPGAKLAYVVGDQASYFRVMIRTGDILCDIAKSLGYHVLHVDLFRTRLATATREQMREEVVVLQWPG